MRESAFWSRLRKGLSPHVHYDRIENSAGNGMPDVTACKRGERWFLELKVFTGKQIKWRFSQIKWVQNSLRAGANEVYIVACDPRREEVFMFAGGDLLQTLAAAQRDGAVRETKDSFIFDPQWWVPRQPHRFPLIRAGADLENFLWT